MKKAISILLSAILLCGCTPQQDNSVQSAESATESTADNTDSEDAEFSRDDFVLFADNNGEQDAVIWLGMERELAEESSAEFAEYFEGIDSISYNEQEETEDGKPTGRVTEYVSLVSYTGSRNYLETVKGIRTAGLYDTAAKPNSTADEVISAYKLNPENESIYIGDPEGDNYTIALYFDIDSDSNVERIISPVGADISDLNSVDGADYFLKFLITQDEVTGIQMYRKRPLNIQ